MSIDIMSAVWKTAPVEGSRLLLLLALADMANDTGVCWPGIEFLAGRVRLKKRQVINLLEDLETAGLIERTHRKDEAGDPDSNLYRVLVGVVHSSTPPSAPQCTTKKRGVVQSSTPGSAPECTTVVHSSAPKSSLNHQLTVNKELEYEPDPDEKFSTMRNTIEQLTGRLSNPGDIPTIQKFLAEGVIEEDIRSALAWRVSQGLRPVANIHQLEAGVLRNKAERVQAAAAATVKTGVTAGRPVKETALDRTKAALQRVMAEAIKEESNGK